MATVTANIEKVISLGGTEYQYHGTLTISGNYTVNGEPIDFGQNTRMDDVVVQGGGYLCEWLPGTQALKVRQGDNTNAAAAPAIELGAVSLAGLSGARFVAWGE